MRFLRTISTTRLLALLAGLVVVVAGGTALAVAATHSSPRPKAEPLAVSVHKALAAKPVDGFYAQIAFTNNLISSADFAGGAKDPILQGTPVGRLWIANDGRMRLELQSDSGDAQLVVNGRHFWISEPSANTVYEGTLPADKKSATTRAQHGIPTIARIQSEITKLMGHLSLGGNAAQTSNPTDVNGRPAYSVSISPKHSAGLLGSLGVAWDAVTGVPLNIAVYSSQNPSTPVLQMQASHVSYGKVDPSVFQVSPPSGAKVVTVASPNSSGTRAKAESKGKHSEVTGVKAVASHLPFTLAAPGSVEGLPRETVKLLDWGGKPAALVTYGQNLGGVAVIEQTADAAGTNSSGSSFSNGSGGMGNVSLPTVTITGANHQALATGQELGTPLGTVLRFSHGGVAYTVVGSVQPYVAEHAASALLSGS